MVFFFIQPVWAAPNETATAIAEQKLPKIRSDESMTIDLATSSAEWIGNVVIDFEPTVITADKLKIYFKENGSGISLGEDSIAKVIVTGNVNIVSEGIVATAQQANYDVETKILVLTGEPATLASDQLDTECPTITLIGFALQPEQP